MPSPSPVRVKLLTIALGALAIGAILLPAGEVAAEGVEEPRRVAMASDLRVFNPVTEGNGASNPSLEVYQEAMQRGVEQQWRSSNHQATVLGGDELDEAVAGAPMYEDNLELAREWGQMGIEAYKQVQTQTAAEYLERSLQYFEAIAHDIVAPREVSEILMYLALSYLEDGTNVVRPLDVLQEMIRRDPGRRLQSGYYPDFVVQYYENARQTLWRELREDGPPEDESKRIAELTDAEFVFHAYAIPTSADAVELVAYLYDVDDEQFLPAERLSLQSLDEQQVQEGFGRLASRLSACLVEAVPEPGEVDGFAPTGTSRLSVMLGMTFGSFLQVPTPVEAPFGNYGMNVGLGWSLTPDFRVTASLQIANSIRDYSGVLADSFTTIRAVAGSELGRAVGPIYLGFGVGLEMSRFGPMQVFTDKSCIPDPDRLCPGSTGRDTFDDEALHWGVQLRPRIAWKLSQTFQFSSSVAMGYYFSPLEDQLLNFPLIGEVGIEYRF